jgi:hypothetical protein
METELKQKPKEKIDKLQTTEIEVVTASFLSLYPQPVLTMAMSPDERFLAVARANNSIEIYDASNVQTTIILLFTLQHDSDFQPQALYYLSTNHTLLSVNRNSTVTVYQF